MGVSSYQRDGIQTDLKPPLVVDPFIIFGTILLVGFSVLMVYSTTGIIAQEKFADPLYYFKRQLLFAVVGLVLMLLVSHLRVDFLKRFSPIFYVLALCSLLLTLLPGVSVSAGGAHRWINLGIQLQPGEFAKVAFVVFLASYFSRHENELAKFSTGLLKPSLLFLPVAILLLLQPDFGSVVIIAIVTLSMALAAGARLRYLCIAGVVLLTAAASLIVISPYRMNRVLAFMSPWSDASGKGYQLIQSLIAVGTGKVFGVGLGASQQKLFFLPAAHTDFIFAVVAEELGFVGAIVLMSLFVLLLWRGMKLATRLVDDTYSYCLAVGFTMLIVVPALLNVGVVTGLLPTKGLVLPLVGYGGSSLVSSLLSIGLLLAVARSFSKERFL